MTELQKTNALLRDVLFILFVQHQDLMWALSPDHYGAWLKRFGLAYRLQKRHKIFTDEEWEIIEKHDIKDAFKLMPGLAKTWPKLRKYYPKDRKKFIDGIMSAAKETSQKSVRKRNKNI